MKNILPWICVLGLSAGVVALFLSNSTKEADLVKLRAQTQEAEALRTQLDEAKQQAQAQTQELAGLRKDNEELLRLRNEIRQLRDDKQQLSKQAQTAQAAAERAQAQAQAQAQAAETARTSASETVQRQVHDRVQQLNACINNLRQIDGAKQQWALEHNKTAEAVPNMQDLLPYFRNGEFPACPGGGQYTIGGMTNAPMCSISGHALPQ